MGNPLEPSPEVVAEGFGFDRSGIYEWLQRYAQGGYPAVVNRTEFLGGSNL
jgi:hypothetical protein